MGRYVDWGRRRDWAQAYLEIFSRESTHAPTLASYGNRSGAGNRRGGREVPAMGAERRWRTHGARPRRGGRGSWVGQAPKSKGWLCVRRGRGDVALVSCQATTKSRCHSVEDATHGIRAGPPPGSERERIPDPGCFPVDQSSCHGAGG